MGSFVFGRICEGCNTGWMKRLEDAVKPIITGLLEGNLRPEQLRPKEKLILAKWVVKTAVVQTHATQSERPIDPVYLNPSLEKETSTPGRCGAAISAFESGALGYMEQPSDVDAIGPEQFAAGTKIVLALPRLAFVSVFPTPGFEYDLEKDNLLFHDLWPGIWRECKGTSLPAVSIPVKWGTDSGEVGQRQSKATLAMAMISEVPHLSQEVRGS
jgi:hypothetical protein